LAVRNKLCSVSRSAILGPMNNQTVVVAPVAGLLGVAFVILKLCKVIGWSWWWVTCPFWGPAALALVIFSVILLVLAVKGMLA